MQTTGAYEKIRKMAEIILREIQSAANAAKGDLAKMKPQSFAKFSQGNDAAVEQEVHRHERLKRRRKDLERMTKKPFIAYAKTEGDGGESVYLIYRGEGPGASSGESGVLHASYFSPAGRSAELDPGDALKLRLTTETVVEKNRFTPHEENEIWDATDNRILLSDLEERNFSSLLEFLPKIRDAEAEDLLFEEIRESEIRRQKEVEESRTRQQRVIDHFVLRDRPILDSSQGEIFRLPLSGGVVVTGAPGTGKTTLLIKRIAKNTSPEFVDSEDVGELSEKDKEGLFHPKNWMFFVPSEHLRLYLKESLEADDLSASNKTVKVWADESKNLARAFGLIGPGKPFQSPSDVKPTFADNASASLTARANDFWAWQEKHVKQKLADAQKEFAANESHSEIANRVAAVVAVDALAVLRQMENMRAEIDKRRGDMDKSADALVDLALRTPNLRESIADIYPAKSEPDNKDDSDANEPPETIAAKPRPRDEKLQIKPRLKTAILWRAHQMRAKPGARKGGRSEKLWEKIAPQMSGRDDELRALSEIDAEIQSLGFWRPDWITSSRAFPNNIEIFAASSCATARRFSPVRKMSRATAFPPRRSTSLISPFCATLAAQITHGATRFCKKSKTARKRKSRSMKRPIFPRFNLAACIISPIRASNRFYRRRLDATNDRIGRSRFQGVQIVRRGYALPRG